MENQSSMQICPTWLKRNTCPFERAFDSSRKFTVKRLSVTHRRLTKPASAEVTRGVIRRSIALPDASRTAGIIKGAIKVTFMPV
jgi:hypothetical protein